MGAGSGPNAQKTPKGTWLVDMVLGPTYKRHLQRQKAAAAAAEQDGKDGEDGGAASPTPKKQSRKPAAKRTAHAKLADEPGQQRKRQKKPEV